MWNRLASATATNGTWGEGYTFDGFGNLTGKTPTAGSAPAMSVPADPATNRPMGIPYDANGNPNGGGDVWDVENRLIGTGAVSNYPATTDYAYDPWGRRMWKETPGGVDGNGTPFPPQGEFYFYGATGQKLETYSFNGPTPGPQFGTVLEGINIYFGGKLLQSKGVWVATDKLGSVRANSNGETFSYFPYGEERTSTADGREKFATYTRDMPGQDYAMRRYYSGSTGAFWTPDPGGIATASPKNPSTWNRYAYVHGDPVNHTDRLGLYVDAEDCGSDPDLCSQCLPGSSFWGQPPGCDDDDGGGGGGTAGSDDDDSPTPCSFSAQDLQSYMLNTTAYTAQGTSIATGAAGRPLAAYASTIMFDAVQDNIDPRLLVAIAFVEGKWGGDSSAANTDNSFGLHNHEHHLANFTNAGGWGASIQAAAGVVARMINQQGLSSVSLLYGGQPGSYCQGSNCLKNKGSVVSNQLKALGGSSSSLTSPCYFQNGSYYEKQ